MSLELIFLGTGTSTGVPMIGCSCPVCRSADPRDQRTRASAAIRYPGSVADKPMQLLIDTAIEMRLQVIRAGIARIDGVFYTHAHADHIFGLDDLRRFNLVMNQPIDVFADASTLERVRAIFRYVFDSGPNVNQSFVPMLIPRIVAPGESMQLGQATWTPLRLLHGRLPILGYRVDYQGASLAYCTDVSSFPPETFALLQNLDVLVIDALRYRHHPTHMTVDQALENIAQIQPRRAFLTHIAHEIEHAELESRLPEHIRIAYDGLTVRCGPE